MSIDKSVLKIAFLEDYGNKFDDLLEGARANLYRVEGSKVFGKLVQERFAALQTRQQKMTETGDCSLEEADRINKNYQTCINLLTHTMQNLDTDLAQARGRVIQLEEVVKLLKKDCDNESAKKSALSKAFETGAVVVEDGPANGVGDSASPGHRPVGLRPPTGLKAQRFAQEALQHNDRVADTIQAAVEGPSPPNGRSAAVLRGTAPKRRGRPPRRGKDS